MKIKNKTKKLHTLLKTKKKKKKKKKYRYSKSLKWAGCAHLVFFPHILEKGPQTFSTVFTRIAGDFGLVAQNPLTENGLLFMILSSSAVPVWDLIKTRIIKLFERKHCLRIYRSVIN